jgi:hypothetical protein
MPPEEVPPPELLPEPPPEPLEEPEEPPVLPPAVPALLDGGFAVVFGSFRCARRFRANGILLAGVLCGRGAGSRLGLCNAGLAVLRGLIRILMEELVPVKQINQQERHQQNQHHQNRRDNAVGTPAGRAPGALPENGTAGLLLLLPVFFLFAKRAAFIGIGKSLPADGAALHRHNGPPA